MIKTTWEQYLSLDISEKEILKLYKKNTIMFNEKYNIWYLKLMPVRVKLPIHLKFDKSVIRLMIKRRREKKNLQWVFMHPWFLTKSYMKELVAWKIFKKIFMRKT